MRHRNLRSLDDYDKADENRQRQISSNANHLSQRNASFFGRRFFWGDKFEGATALLAQTNKAEQHFGVHEDYGGNHF